MNAQATVHALTAGSRIRGLRTNPSPALIESILDEIAQVALGNPHALPIRVDTAIGNARLALTEDRFDLQLAAMFTCDAYLEATR